MKSTRRATALSSKMIVKVQCILILFCVLTPTLNSQRNKEFEFPNDGTPNGGFVINNDGEQNGGFVINDDGDDSAGNNFSSGAKSMLMILFPTFIARELIFHV